MANSQTKTTASDSGFDNPLRSVLPQRKKTSPVPTLAARTHSLRASVVIRLAVMVSPSCAAQMGAGAAKTPRSFRRWQLVGSVRARRLAAPALVQECSGR